MLIGIGSNMRVGKDSAAQGLMRDLGFRRVGFADALKDVAMKADPMVIPQQMAVNVGIGHGRLAWVVKGSGWEDAKNKFPEVRTFLQRLGLAIRETLGEDIWVRHVLEGVKPGENVVIPDVRFENEAEAIKDAGGLLIRINRPGYGKGSHVSETALEDFQDWDLVWDNDSSIHDMQTGIVAWVRGQMKAAPSASAA